MSLTARQLRRRLKLMAIYAIVVLALQLCMGAFAPEAEAHKNEPSQCPHARIVGWLVLVYVEGMCTRLAPYELSERVEHPTHVEHDESRRAENKKKPEN